VNNTVSYRAYNIALPCGDVKISRSDRSLDQNFGLSLCFEGGLSVSYAVSVLISVSRLNVSALSQGQNFGLGVIWGPINKISYD